MADAPGYWMHETSGVLRPAVEAYLAGDPMLPDQIAKLRAYLRQWIMSPLWDQNPHMTTYHRAWLDQMRLRVGGLKDRGAIDRWLSDATGAGLDPL